MPFSSNKSLLLEYLIRLKSIEWKKTLWFFWTKFWNSGHSERLARGLSYSIVSHTWSPQWMPGIILNWRYPVLYTYIFVYTYFSVFTSFFMSKKYNQQQWKKAKKKNQKNNFWILQNNHVILLVLPEELSEKSSSTFRRNASDLETCVIKVITIVFNVVFSECYYSTDQK